MSAADNLPNTFPGYQQSPIVSNFDDPDFPDTPGTPQRTVVASCSDGGNTENTEEQLIEFRAKLNRIQIWTGQSDFFQIDGELERLQIQYMGRLHDGLMNEAYNESVIERGKIVGNLHTEKSKQIMHSTTSIFGNAVTLLSEASNKIPLNKNLATNPQLMEIKQEPPDTPVIPTVQRRGKRKRNSIDHEHYMHIKKNEALDPPEYACTICNRQFKNRLNIRYHIACADKSAGHACKECDRIFKSSSHLTYHMRTAHGGEKPYKCRFCEKAFAQSVKLKRHERTHTGERPFKCVTCEHTFTTKYNLKEHENIHKAEKPYICARCGSGFADRNNLRRHELTHGTASTEKRLKKDKTIAYPCDFCSRICDNLFELERHQHACHANEKGFKCQVCGWIFAKTDNLVTHFRERHGVANAQGTCNNLNRNNKLEMDASKKPSNQKCPTVNIKSYPMIPPKYPQPVVNYNNKSREDFFQQHHIPQESTPPSLEKASDIIALNGNKLEWEGSKHTSDQTVPAPDVDMVSNKSMESGITANVRANAFKQVKELLKQVQGDEIYRVIESLTSKERRTLIEILKADAHTKKGIVNRGMDLHILPDKYDTFSEISTGSKKEFLRRYKKQILEESNSVSSAASSISFPYPSAMKSLTAHERQQLLDDIEDDTQTKGPTKHFHSEEFPTPAITNHHNDTMLKSFDSIMKGIHSIISKQVETGKPPSSTVTTASEKQPIRAVAVKQTDMGLRKVSVFDDEDQGSE